MFKKIRHPSTGKWANVNGSIGKRILENYLIQLGGGTADIYSNQSGGVTVFSDYDDTIIAAGKEGVSGYDQALSPHTAYPGLAKLYESLISNSSNPSRSDTLYILTARPMNIPGHPMHMDSYKSLSPEVLFGRMEVGIYWGLQKLLNDYTIMSTDGIISNPQLNVVKSLMGQSKYTKWKGNLSETGGVTCKNVAENDHVKTSPSVFFGDNAQGDVAAIRNMIDMYVEFPKCRTRSKQTTLNTTPPIFRGYVHNVLNNSILDILVGGLTTDVRVLLALKYFIMNDATKLPLPRESLPNFRNLSDAQKGASIKLYQKYKLYRKHICIYRHSFEAANDALEHGLLKERQANGVYKSFLIDSLAICREGKLNSQMDWTDSAGVRFSIELGNRAGTPRFIFRRGQSRETKEYLPEEIPQNFFGKKGIWST